MSVARTNLEVVVERVQGHTMRPAEMARGLALDRRQYVPAQVGYGHGSDVSVPCRGFKLTELPSAEKYQPRCFVKLSVSFI